MNFLEKTEEGRPENKILWNFFVNHHSVRTVVHKSDTNHDAQPLHVRRGYMVLNFVSHKHTLSMIVIRRQGIIIFFQPFEGYSLRPQLYKDGSEVQTVVPQWPMTRNTVFCQQGFSNLAPR
jgi:hypothetical protein